MLRVFPNARIQNVRQILSQMTNSKIYFIYYTQIVRAVVVHESALKSQAKKMNVESFRSNEVFILLLSPYKNFFIANH